MSDSEDFDDDDGEALLREMEEEAALAPPQAMRVDDEMLEARRDGHTLSNAL